MGILNFMRRPGLKRRTVRIAKRFVKPLHPRYWPINPKYWKTFERPRVVYMVGMPRTGSTLMKRYLGEHDGLVIAPAAEYLAAWELAVRLSGDQIVIDKYTRNMPRVAEIYRKYGNQVWFAGIVRDPRDELVSLLETDRHPEIPRDEQFWEFWIRRYQGFFEFARKYSRKGTRVCLTRYEDLVCKPVQVKCDFLRWLDLDVSANELSNRYCSVIPEIASEESDAEDWKTHQHNRVHTNSLGRWREITDSGTLQLLTHYRQLPKVQRFMLQLGYGDQIEDLHDSIQGVDVLGVCRD